jgi:hypothetical protein
MTAGRCTGCGHTDRSCRRVAQHMIRCESVGELPVTSEGQTDIEAVRQLAEENYRMHPKARA